MSMMLGRVLDAQDMVILGAATEFDVVAGETILEVSVRVDARSAGRCGRCRKASSGYDQRQLPIWSATKIIEVRKLS